MKNTRIDVALRKAFLLGEEYRAALQSDDLNAARGAWGELEQRITEAMLEENGDTNMVDEENERRKRFGRMR